MIRSVKLRDFQRHKLRRIVFSKGITTIEGPTNRGKSSIIRALRWVLLNDFRGIPLRKGAKTVSVRVKIGGKWVGRKKGANVNVYTLGKKKFKAFGTKVPEEIQAHLKLNGLNFQGQFDPIFWFSSTGGEVSKQLNRVIDLSIVDTSLGKIASEVRSRTARREVSEERLGQLKDQLAKLESQRPRIVEFKKLKELYEQLSKTEAARDRLDELLTGARANKPEGLLQKASEAEVIMSRLGAVVAIEERHGRLERLISDGDCFERIQPPPDLGPISKAFNQLHSSHAGFSLLSVRIDLLEWTRKQIKSAEERAKVLSDNLKLETEYQICPTCGQPIKQSL